MSNKLLKAISDAARRAPNVISAHGKWPSARTCHIPPVPPISLSLSLFSPLSLSLAFSLTRGICSLACTHMGLGCGIRIAFGRNWRRQMLPRRRQFSFISANPFAILAGVSKIGYIKYSISVTYMWYQNLASFGLSSCTSNCWTTFEVGSNKCNCFTIYIVYYKVT